MPTNLSELLMTLLSIPGALFAFTLKGYSQALVAKKLGDPTPEAQGKLTMNPIAHIDIVGFICILLFGFGWCKPVLTNSRYYKNVKRDKSIQILSGPVGLIAGGFVMSFFTTLLALTYSHFNNTVFYYLYMVFLFATMYSVSLAFFYLLPLPGLDGYNFIANLLPYRCNRVLYNIEKYSMFIFLGFILVINLVPSVSEILSIPANVTYNAFMNLWALVFRL